jgi:hypothetical protein
MSISSRQKSLLVAEDWKKVYETFREADFQSYDFETLRKSMVDYLRLYYPEDFNDYIESSEYIALIDLLAFLGQSLAFRADLNARENFLDTAERRDSILKLARLVNYTPKRHINSTGVLKIQSVTTSEGIIDSNGKNLSNVSITWNDPTNVNWLEQFQIILNSALIDSQLIGKPGNTQILNGITTEEYSINIQPNIIPVFNVQSSINGTSTNFEVVSATTANRQFIYEEEPIPRGKFNILYRNDNQGNNSNNTGFFLFFKQGQLTHTDFNFPESMPNRVFHVTQNNINNSDVWLYSINPDGTYNQLWKNVPTVSGLNVIYNKSTDRNLYQVNTKVNDQIELVFGDGSFANIPQGTFRVYHRISNGTSYKITPEEMQAVSISFQYITRSKKVETIRIVASLKYTVNNSAERESLEEIRQKAPQQYYTQNRMITGEDYNILPYTSFSNILKIKAVNRTSSGISRYLDVNDASGKYSSTNIFAQDGLLYKEEEIKSKNFTFINTTTVRQMVQGDLVNILNSRELLHFYYDKFPRYPSDSTKWALCSLTSNGCTGYFVNAPDSVPFSIKLPILQVGISTSSAKKYIRNGATIRFVAPGNQFFNSQNNLVTRANNLPQTGDKKYLYVAVMQIINDGTNGGVGAFTNGTGPVILNQKVPSGAKIDQILPVFKNNLSSSMISDIVIKILNYNDFALRYDLISESWKFVSQHDINVTDPFNIKLTNAPFPTSTVGAPGDTSKQKKDASWLIRFEYNANVGYTIYSRSTNYFFESSLETKFYFDNQVKVYDSQTGTTIRDQINILKINNSPDKLTQLGVDYKWFIYKNVIDVDGYQSQNKVLLTFPDENTDGIADNPDIFDIIVGPTINLTKEQLVDKLIFFKNEVDYDTFFKLVPIDSFIFEKGYPTKDAIMESSDLFEFGQLFYAYNEGLFYVLTKNGIVQTQEYVAKYGRQDLYFQYRHNSPGYRRIDPSPNNIIDLFILTKTYAEDYKIWIRDSSNKIEEPLPPSTEQLKLEYSNLDNYKAISDSIIFNSAKFKPLFGNSADVTLQATFKVVKNPAMNVSDNDVKSKVIDALNSFFDVDNWEFGEPFFFSELSAYLHSVLTPIISSIVIVPVDTKSKFGALHQINAEANEILSNPEKRDLYDKWGMEGVQAGGNPNGMGGFGDIFSFFGGGGGARRDTGPKKGKPKLIEVQITLE